MNRRYYWFVIVVAVGMIVTGCGGNNPSKTETASQQTDVQLDPSRFGTVSVSVRLNGDEPDPKTQYTGANPECKRENLTLDRVQPTSHQRLQNVLVAVKEGPEGFHTTGNGLSSRAVMNQKHCRYKPQLLAVQTGQTITFKNSDPGMHNVRVTKEGDQVFNETTMKNQSFKKTFDQPGIYTTQCDVHNWMKAWIYVSNHNKMAVTGKDGKVKLSNLPPGTYKLKIWHPVVGSTTKQINLKPQGNASLTVTLGL